MDSGIELVNICGLYLQGERDFELKQIQKNSNLLTKRKLVTCGGIDLITACHEFA